MNTKRDKFLTEAMEEEFSQYTHEIYKENNLSTWEGFGKLWEWAQKQEWWKEFCFSPIGDGYHCYIVSKGLDKFAIGCAYIHPDRFADAVYQFLKGSK